MREQLHTIPVNEAFLSEDECPFCYLQRQTEQRIIRYVVGPGASYMEPDVRGVTDRVGCCNDSQGHSHRKERRFQARGQRKGSKARILYVR